VAEIIAIAIDAIIRTVAPAATAVKAVVMEIVAKTVTVIAVNAAAIAVVDQSALANAVHPNQCL
jgi:hypothetical protein